MERVLPFLSSAPGVAAIIIAAVGAVLVMILVTVAKQLKFGGIYDVYCRRLAMLNEREIKLDISFSNETKTEKKIVGLSLAKKKDKEMIPIVGLALAPIARGNDYGVVSQKDGVYVLSIAPGSSRSVVVDFLLPKDFSLKTGESLYLIGTDGFDKPIRAKFDLSSRSQSLRFKRY